MKRRFFNNLLKKKRHIEVKTFHKKSQRLQQLYTEGEQQMDEDIIKYSTGIMSLPEEALFEFRLSTEPLLKTRLAAYLNNR